MLLCTVVTGYAEKRVALVVGNGAYRHADKLVNPVNDARGMRDKLKSPALGFEVIYGEDLDLKGLGRAIGQFAGRVEDADVAIVYFAGHGATFGDTSYVVPVDAEFASLTEVPLELVPVETLIGDLSRAKGMRIAILDACSDNAAGARGGCEVTRGLGPMKSSTGLTIAYTTQYLSAAADDAGSARPGGPFSRSNSSTDHNPFTAALLNNIATPGLDVTDMFRKAGREVDSATGGRQRPEISISMYDEYALVPASPKPAPATPASGSASALFAVPTAALAPWEKPAPVELPAEVASLPAVAALQRNDPVAFDRFKKRYANSAVNARRDEEMTLARSALRKSVKHLLAISSGDVLLEMTETSLSYLQGLQFTNPETCVWLTDDNKGARLTSNLAKDLPMPYMREMSVLERIASTNPYMVIAPISDEEVRPYFEKVLNSLRRQNVKTHLQARKRLDPSEFAPYCELVIAFYQAVLDLPSDDKINVLRNLYAKAAVNADSDLKE
jgi:uncharacterized caspase-like protein